MREQQRECVQWSNPHSCRNSRSNIKTRKTYMHGANPVWAHITPIKRSSQTQDNKPSIMLQCFASSAALTAGVRSYCPTGASSATRFKALSHVLCSAPTTVARVGTPALCLRSHDHCTNGWAGVSTASDSPFMQHVRSWWQQAQVCCTPLLAQGALHSQENGHTPAEPATQCGSGFTCRRTGQEAIVWLGLVTSIAEALAHSQA